MPAEVLCPIWGTPAARLGEYQDRDGIGVDSPRAGGRYFISRSAQMQLQSADDATRVKVTHEIVDHNMLSSTPEIMTTTIDGLAQVAPSRPQDRAQRLLLCLVRASAHLGQTLDGFSVGNTTRGESYIHFGTKAGPKAWPLFAWSDSTQDDEVVFLLQMLEESHAIRLSDRSPIPDVVVLPRGYELVRSATGDVQLDQAFIAMWFDSSMSDAYELGIEAAVRECGDRPLRIDQKEHVNKIDDEIIAEIRRSRFLVADFTSKKGTPRGGVYFEAGFAFALEKPVIWCCRADLIDEVHFDTRQFNHIVWQEPLDLKEKLKNRIGAVLGLGPFRQS
jgi:hypothetical protein